jgi:fructoselysine-6-P-deglycase FrlB-like protein
MDTPCSVAASLSGDAEEVLALAEQAGNRRAVVVCLTGGGRLAQAAREEGYPLAALPPSLPGEGYAAAGLLAGCSPGCAATACPVMLLRASWRRPPN